MSPTRRRKKVRRLSNEQVTPLAPAAPEHEDIPCKEEVSRDGVEDLTLDEDAGDASSQHNDVVRSKFFNLIIIHQLCTLFNFNYSKFYYNNNIKNSVFKFNECFKP